MLTTFPEPMVARVAGVKKAVLAALRREHLVKDTDWQLAGAVVHYTQSGLERVLRHAGIDAKAFSWPMDLKPGVPSTDSDSGDAPEATAPKPDAAAQAVSDEIERVADAVAARALAQLFVRSVPKNPKILFCSLASGEVVPVRVRENKNFRAGMFLKAREPGPGSTAYNHEGNCPRFPGRY